MDLNKIKLILIISFVVLAGTLYSCNHKNNDIISLDNSDLNNVDDQGISEESSDIDNPIQEDLTIEESPTESQKLIYVHICGAVKTPNVYPVKEYTRLFELVEIAGGLSPDAAGDFINQAATVSDGDQVYIPTRQEVEESNLTIPIASSNEQGSDKVNINTASRDELMTLTGIGESKANSIIDYRQKHGDFNKIEDIMNISGIKDAAFNKISEFITVN